MSGWRFNNSRIGTFEFADRDPWSSPTVNVDGVWNTDRAYNTDVPSPVPPPPPVGNLPLTTDAKLQWAVDITAGPSTWTTGSTGHQIIPFGGAGVYGTDNWVVERSATRVSYTPTQGGTEYYLPVPSGNGGSAVNLMTRLNSWDGPTVIAEGGFTLFGTYVPGTSSGWSRLFNYFGMGAATPNTSTSAGVFALSSTSQYSNTIVFQNSNGTIEQRRPSATTSNGAYAQFTISGAGSGSVQSMSFVFRMEDTGVSNYWYRNRNRSTGVLTNTANKGTFNFQSSPLYGVKTSTNTARPVIADDIYSSNTGLAVMAMAFANRPYTDQECQDVVDYLDNRFG